MPLATVHRAAAADGDDDNRSGASWRTAAAASTCRSVGFSSTSSKTNTSSPASRSDCMARCGWPAASRPGSVTSRTRVPPSSRHKIAGSTQGARSEDDAAQRLIVEWRHQIPIIDLSN